jgi:SAM-dependent methyltransferase
MQNEANTCADQGVDPFLELESVRALAGSGDLDLATLRAIRLGSALQDLRQQGLQDLLPLEAEVLSDLSTLRYERADLAGARALARACLELVPDHAVARENLVALEVQPTAVAEDRSQDPLPSKLNPWVRQALDMAQREEGLAGKDVIEVGGAVPEEHARATGASSWSGFYLGAAPKQAPGYEIRNADARAIPWPDRSFDLAFSSCAFEHIGNLPVALKEIARVLRPGGVLVTSFAPIWSCAVGHHLWGRLADGTRVHILDPVVPLFGHLLTNEHELGWFLAHTLGKPTGAQFAELVFRNAHINRVFEAQFREMFEAAGFDDSRIAEQGPWNPAHVPTPAMRAELEARHPGMGSFESPGFEGVLRLGRKRNVEHGPRPRAGRTIFLGLHS